MLSSAAAEYYEASEACREIAFIRGILSDFCGKNESDPLSPTPLMIDKQAAIAMGQIIHGKTESHPNSHVSLEGVLRRGISQLIPCIY
jgi:hypothetical protein